MNIADGLIILSTLMGPVAAVQAQKWIERSREARTRKTRLFETLMATRGARLSSEHVRALNMIDLTFFGKIVGTAEKRSANEQLVLDAWHEYHDNLCTPIGDGTADNSAIFARRDELFINILFAMATDLGFRFDRVQLKKSHYTPIAHNQFEERQTELISTMIGVFSGRAALKVAPVDAP